MLNAIALTVLSHLAPITPDAFYVAPHDAVLASPPVASDPACIPKDPDKDYRLFVSPLWDPTCYNRYVGTFTLSRNTYWAMIGACAPLDCACYAAAWKWFSDTMAAAEAELRNCSPT